MDRLSRFVVLIVLSVLGKNLCLGETSLNPFPLGTIGCLVSDVCDSGQICTNDLLFGSCQSIFSRVLNGENKFRLRTQQIERLEDEIERLIKAGFTWKDAFTQCTLQNTLLEFSKERIFDRFLCEDALGVSSEDWPDGVNNEIAAVLLELLKSGELNLFDQTNAERAEAGLDILNSNKRDEIVQVHKYFDKSKGQLKRDPYFEDTDSSYNILYPNESPDPYSLYYSKNLIPTEDDYSTYPYFDGIDEGTDSSESNLETEEGLPQDDDAIPYLDDIPQPSYGARGLETAMGVQDPENTRTEEELPLEPTMENLSLSSDDEKTLEGLLEGTVSPDSLEKEQQARLQVFIQGLIRVLEDNEGDLTSSLQPDNDVPESFMDVDQDTSAAIGPGDMDETSPEEVIPPEDLTSKREDLNVMRAQLLNSDILMDKKTLEEDEKEAESVESMDPVDPPGSPRAVDSHSMYLQLSKEVSIPSGMLFVQNLTDILKLPPGLIGFIQVGPGRMINLEVNTDPEGKWNAERIANEAQLVNDDLVKATGISVEGAGVGRDGNRLEVKPNESYEVLTFVLVGTIAGVVLAVVTIYLIKRHHRSKQKLAQLASNGEGNEASKDYQDLCRQRMQGKSSEKPEPLHAASRIGSVSETQVRSPSSRSSTSSWSEEPAATNMDISTGHIVLSYMEDHLKNQDRLDREWEAVSSYMADPSSTKIATDPSNMRKNRFADTLPYDHSRVILSSNANVANSDYINASFITDHDPRNPAYICTQGPLPHTVADFWQMIWEQGSVVIVMLTKLGENGTGLCHRYWPEEGSDLYHIYEVHLVSEHIWCDDYLVRSFYLKNLQTNETRTVTQFHFLTWPQLSVPASIKALLDFRRKVNKSFRGRSCPIVVHCSEGCGRSGTYCLIDMVLNKMAKGAKEIDMAATLEHIRDQRMSMVKTKEQFQFSLAAVAEEVHAILKALPQ